MKYLLMVVLLFTFSQAQALLIFMSGGQLLEKCEAHLSETGSVAVGNVCAGYVAGISDVHASFVEWGDMTPKWCVPLTGGTKQMVRVVTKYLQEHPEDLHRTAGGQVANALSQAFPCE